MNACSCCKQAELSNCSRCPRRDVHLKVDVPKKYSKLVAEIMLKRHSAARIFRETPNFRKRRPRGSFWFSYEHYESVGKTHEESSEYVRSQAAHHNVEVIDDTPNANYKIQQLNEYRGF